MNVRPDTSRDPSRPLGPLVFLDMDQQALDDQRAVRRPDFLIVGLVQRLLVHVEEDQRT